MRHHTWDFLIQWTSRMAMKFGGAVYDHEGNTYDWGQALMREIYGKDWMSNEDFKLMDAKDSTEPVPNDIILRAANWETGDSDQWPSWVDFSKMLNPSKSNP